MAALLAGGLGAYAPALAQDQAQTLADIRQELTVLHVELQRLKGEFNTTGGATASNGGGTLLDRVNALEAELTRLTAKT
ncbi:MAG TPA: tol-pal system protein, partial [Rhodobacterales bacterium]|nr:tol-pal system protein [Rhodobacterales bacterium]